VQYNALAYLAPRHQVRVISMAHQAPLADHVKRVEELVGCEQVLAFHRDWAPEYALGSYLSYGVFLRGLMSPRLQRLLPSVCDWAQVVQVESMELAFNLLSVLATANGVHRPAVVFRVLDIMSLHVAQYAAEGSPSTWAVRNLCPPIVRAALLKRKSAQYRRLESTVFRTVDAVVPVSREDTEIIRTEHPGVRIHHIPIGIDVRHIPSRGNTPPFTREPGSARRRPTLTFPGTFSWSPNVDAAMVLVREILPRLSDMDLRVLIVGKDPPRILRQHHDGVRIHVMGYVPDMDAIWRETDLAVVPVRYGTGVKTKTIDALAHGIPVVTFPGGRRGVEGSAGVDFVEAKTDQEFADGVRRVLNDPDLYRRLAENGRRLAEERHAREGTGAQFEALYTQLLAGAHPMSEDAWPPEVSLEKSS
jgi:glycosyltransferase involved in cell wall biosynthesis